MKSSSLFMSLACLLAGAAVIAAFSLMDSPHAARLHKLDEGRVSDLQRISRAVGLYRKNHAHLPDALSALDMPATELKDPATDAPYEYKMQGADGYELCATFGTVPPPEQNTMGGLPLNYGSCQSAAWWKHAAGHYCYTISVKGCKGDAL